MANWKQLDAEFYEAMENMTEEDWFNWKQNESKESNLRQKKNERGNI